MPPTTTEIIDLCDSSSDDSPLALVPVSRARATPVAPNLRTQLRDSERARRVLNDERTALAEKASTLERELSEARSRLAELEAKQSAAPTMMESDAPHAEIIRCLNQDLGRQTQLSAENYAKFQNAKRAIANYKSVIDTLWRAVECPVCFEPIWEPAAYTCGHIICQGCATSPACAHCRAPTQGVIKVYAIRDVVRTIAPLAAPSSQSPKKAPR